AVPDAVAEAVTARLKIPTIGIGAGPHCDGQVLVSYDMLGLFDTHVPKFVRQYAQLGELIVDAARNYASDVCEGVYPQSAAARRDGDPVLVEKCLCSIPAGQMHRAWRFDVNLEHRR